MLIQHVLPEHVSCPNNQITSLAFHNNPNIIEINCGNNKLMSIALYKNYKLKKLDCRNNYLAIIDVSDCTELYKLSCTRNLLTKLNLKQNKKLRQLYCYKNKNLKEICITEDFLKESDFYDEWDNSGISKDDHTVLKTDCE